MTNKKNPIPAGAMAPARQYLPRLSVAAPAMRARHMPVAFMLPISGAAGAHAYPHSQVIFFGHDLPQDYHRRR